ncbi:putative ribosomal protein L18e/L15P [Abeliophyllum distichum]|uniref:Ribosomal protein L18e/L15P n=1 Tax=Abeliophyllum distichum TaxID=126358 RepID=A0ABD1RDZ0_9LAMI
MVSSLALDLDVDLEKGKALQSSFLNFSSKYSTVPHINLSAALDTVNDISIEVASGSRVTVRVKAAIEVAGGSVRRVYYNKLGFRALLELECFEKKARLLPKASLEEILQVILWC